jgi:hypothetical protein
MILPSLFFVGLSPNTFWIKPYNQNFSAEPFSGFFVLILMCYPFKQHSFRLNLLYSVKLNHGTYSKIILFKGAIVKYAFELDFSNLKEIFSKIFKGIWCISEKIFGKIYLNLGNIAKMVFDDSPLSQFSGSNLFLINYCPYVYPFLGYLKRLCALGMYDLY